MIDGTPYKSMTPEMAREKGIGAVYQEFTLVRDLPVVENVFMGNLRGNGWLVDKKAMVREAREIFDDFGVDIDPNAMLNTLSPAMMQIVEIAKAVSLHTRVLILDEPTAPLTVKEVDTLFAIIRKLKVGGVSIIFLVIALIVAFVLNKTYMGRYFFAVGGSNDAARLSGINVGKVKLIASAICGLLTGIAGIIMMSRSFSGSPYSGSNISNDVISAAVLGGVSISGGTGKTSGVVTGMLVIGVLSQGLVMTGLSNNYQNMIKGAVLILAVILDTRSKMAKAKRPAKAEG